MDLRKAILVVALASACAAQEIAAKADAFLSAYEQQKKFSGVAVIAKDGKPLFAKAYGMANADWRIPNDLETRFRLGSITKQFTAAAILKLEEQGKLKTGAKACDYLPSCPPLWQSLTIHQLLNHTAGLPNFTAVDAYRTIQSRPSRSQEQLKLIEGKPLDFDPGTKFSYSNTGYLLLGLIIEKASGMPFEAYLAKEIFTPAGMTSTLSDSTNAVIPKRAEGYVSNGGKMTRAKFIDMSIPGAAGNVLSTAEDLVRWDRALAENKVISAESRARMLTAEKGNYGYGSTVGNLQGKRVDGHGGGIDGFVTNFARIADDNVAVIVLSNFEDAPLGEIFNGLMRLSQGGAVELPVLRQEIELDTATLDEYLGRYEIAPTFSIVFTREGKQLITQGTGQGKLPVFAEAKDKLFAKAVNATLEIQRANGKVTGLILKQGGREIKAPKVE